MRIFENTVHQERSSLHSGQSVEYTGGLTSAYSLGARTTRKSQSLSSSPLARIKRLKIKLVPCIPGWSRPNKQFIKPSCSSSYFLRSDFSIRATQCGIRSSFILPVTGTRCREQEQIMVIPEANNSMAYTKYLYSVAQSCHLVLHPLQRVLPV